MSDDPYTALHSDADDTRSTDRLAGFLKRMEEFYLGAVRILSLLIASILIVAALWYAISGIYNASKDVASVEEKTATVTPDEVIQVDFDEPSEQNGEDLSDPFKNERQFYEKFLEKYYSLFQNKFEMFKKDDDNKLSEADFDERYLNTEDRLQRLADSGVGFSKDKSDLEKLFTVISAASDKAITKKRLRAYKNAKMKTVSHTITGTRSERYCSYYSSFINECIVHDTRKVPYKRVVKEEKLPDGVIGYKDLFSAYQNEFVSLLESRRDTNMFEASEARRQIVRDNATGKNRLWLAVRLVSAFMVLMFLFLLVALERHQRKLAKALSRELSPEA